MAHGESVAIEDIFSDDRVPQDAYRSTFVKSLAMVPIRAVNRGGAVGTYWMAHDFNNLLMGTMGYTQMCRDRVDADDPIQEWLDEITHEAERSANLTQQLRTLARRQTVGPRG
jgi:signal transduction histidine kinase